MRSVKKLGGTMAAATDLFSYSSFTLFYNKDQYSADGAEPLRIFYHLREDLEKTSLASYLAQLAEELVPQGEPAPGAAQALFKLPLPAGGGQAHGGFYQAGL